MGGVRVGAVRRRVGRRWGRVEVGVCKVVAGRVRDTVSSLKRIKASMVMHGRTMAI